MSGGVSHVDSFDYKPKLIDDHNKSYNVPQRMLEAFAPNNRVVEKYLQTAAVGVQAARPIGAVDQRSVSARRRVCRRPVPDPLDAQRSPRPLRGHAGHPHRLVDVCPAQHRRLGQLRPGHREPQPAVVHGAGSRSCPTPGRPGLGLGLPARLPSGHARGSRAGADAEHPAPAAAPDLQELELGLAQASIAGTWPSGRGDATLDARIRCFETAFGMQAEAPEAFDLSQETDATLKLYGLQRGGTRGFGWQCLVARRLVERGVRFVELIDTGSSGNWDSHGNMNDHVRLARNVDQPIAGLAPGSEAARHAGGHAGGVDDRVWPDAVQHRPATPPAANIITEVFSSWLAGGGVKGGFVHGAERRARHRGRGRRRSTFTTSTPPSCTCSAWTTSG